MTPDKKAMLAHVEHLFGGDLDGLHDGRIELAWTDTDGKLKHANTFGTDQLDELIDNAVEKNSIEGQNVYIGAALRKPDTPPFGRGTDADFFGLTAYYADLDDAGVAEAARSRCGSNLPTAVIVTGKKPHERAQLWWRLREPDVDIDHCRAVNTSLAQRLEGDRTVVNASRVMRLGGSVAWPVVR